MLDSIMIIYIWICVLHCIDACILKECMIPPMYVHQRCYTDDISDPCRADRGCYITCPDGSSHKVHTLMQGTIHIK